MNIGGRLTMAEATPPEVENPKNASDIDSTPSTTEDASITPPSVSSDGGRGGEAKDKVAEMPVRAGDEDGGDVAITDIHKKMKRAERFGMPVQLSEEEKRSSRAERFGTATSVGESDSAKPSEELKRKARAERFGIVQSEPSNEEVKKKARLARFGSSKPDPIEEEKKKARAIRFSQPRSGSIANGKGDDEVKPKTITGETVGET
ncbi:protein MODIFIER OF SNC1 11-like isoform X2 [Andrographis paniculata]|uniref:protein MODIFIER OF SNC1 11-like isoform X2 n=1 Tax=Andrographis paniculata TaxID=175694 RepID=UPI0021E992F0|nr:protein MODIFIER OF SNC1 11-like isoform X2 [Andrographis paniculata]XP_051126862.1 protein MODIFIER OF SNC1 11-like isoform X2 [Andrographis paniculata]